MSDDSFYLAKVNLKTYTRRAIAEEMRSFETVLEEAAVLAVALALLHLLHAQPGGQQAVLVHQQVREAHLGLVGRERRPALQPLQQNLLVDVLVVAVLVQVAAKHVLAPSAV